MPFATDIDPSLFGWNGRSIAPTSPATGAPIPGAPAPAINSPSGLNNPSLGSRAGVVSGVPVQGPSTPNMVTGGGGVPPGVNPSVGGSLYSQLLASIFGPQYQGLLGTGGGGAPLSTGAPPAAGSSGGLFGAGTGRSNNWDTLAPTPEQAYALNLQARSAATTGPMNLLYQIMYNNEQLARAPQVTSSSWFPTSQPSTIALNNNNALMNNQLTLANSGVTRAAQAAGGSTLYAPAPTPAWGYPKNYGDAPFNNIRPPSNGSNVGGSWWGG